MNLKDDMLTLSEGVKLRYAPVLLGLLVFLFSQTILTWKESSALDASGAFEAVNLEYTTLEKKGDKARNSEEKKEYYEESKELYEEDFEDAKREAAEESIDAKSGIWFWSMLRMLGGSIMALSLLAIASTGVPHEKIGALIAMAVIIANL